MRLLVPVLLSGALDVAGNTFFVLAGQAGRLDVAAILSSDSGQFPFCLRLEPQKYRSGPAAPSALKGQADAEEYELLLRRDP